MACLPLKAFAEILQRLQNQGLSDEADAKVNKSQTDKSKSKQSKPDAVSKMLASHLDTQVRIQPFLLAKQTFL